MWQYTPTNDDEFILGILKESNDAAEETKKFHEQKFTPIQ